MQHIFYDDYDVENDVEQSIDLAMENGPFIDGLHILKRLISMAMLNNQRVISFFGFLTDAITIPTETNGCPLPYVMPNKLGWAMDFASCLVTGLVVH
jgi:hypothetical protein